jgi:hypothetical protein
MKPKFVSGRANLALTIMVPFDCPNKCPFCESKKEYAKNRPSLDGVISAIQRFYRDNNTLDVPEVVITGGEPMANITALRKIISVIPSDKDVYINTTLLKRNFADFCDLVNNTPQIKGINVSRHGYDYNDDCELLHGIAPDHWLSKITKPIRINCVVNNGTNIYEILDRWVWHKGVELSLRENFNTMTLGELHNPYSGFLPRLASEFHYVGHTQCKVCDTTTFRAKQGGLVVRYHKGIKNTLVTLHDDKYEINDIIIRQDGQVFCDWDFTNKTLLPTQLLRDNMRELMARSREKMVEIATTPSRCGGGDGKGHLRQCLPENYTSCGGVGGCGGIAYTPRFSCGGGGTCGGGMGCGGYATCG